MADTVIPPAAKPDAATLLAQALEDERKGKEKAVTPAVTLAAVASSSTATTSPPPDEVAPILVSSTDPGIVTRRPISASSNTTEPSFTPRDQIPEQFVVGNDDDDDDIHLDVEIPSIDPEAKHVLEHPVQPHPSPGVFMQQAVGGSNMPRMPGSADIAGHQPGSSLSIDPESKQRSILEPTFGMDSISLASHPRQPHPPMVLVHTTTPDISPTPSHASVGFQPSGTPAGITPSPSVGNLAAQAPPIVVSPLRPTTAPVSHGFQDIPLNTHGLNPVEPTPIPESAPSSPASKLSNSLTSSPKHGVPILPPTPAVDFVYSGPFPHAKTGYEEIMQREYLSKKHEQLDPREAVRAAEKKREEEHARRWAGNVPAVPEAELVKMEHEAEKSMRKASVQFAEGTKLDTSVSSQVPLLVAKEMKGKGKAKMVDAGTGMEMEARMDDVDVEAGEAEEVDEEVDHTLRNRILKGVVLGTVTIAAGGAWFTML